MDGKKIADEFISRSGRTTDYDRGKFVDDLIDVSSFLLWAETENQHYAGVDAKDAFRSLCRLLDVDVIGLRKAIMVDWSE